MNHRISLGLLIVGILAGCDRGCVTSERIIVKYHGRASLQSKATATRDGQHAGFVEEVLAGREMTRLVVRTKSAAQFTDKDRFAIVESKDGKGELQAVGGRGRPLKDGDEIDADPAFSLKMKYALDRSPGGITLPSGYYLPFPHALTEDPARREERAVKNMAKRIEKNLKLRDEKVNRLPVDLRGDYANLLDEMVGKTPDEALEIIEERGKPIETAAENLAQLSHDSRDFETARQAKYLATQINRAEKMAKREAKHVRSRPRHMPPEFDTGEPEPVREREVRPRHSGPRNPRTPKHTPRADSSAPATPGAAKP